jgi:hypothetical protein
MGLSEDVEYAVAVTQVVREPREVLETFGTTKIRFHLVSELMDDVDKVRIRMGTIESARPEILVPSALASQLLDGFGEEAREYAEWLANHGELMQILRYGLQFRRECDSEDLVHESIAEVLPRVAADVERRNPSHETVLVGADELWEVSLLKFMFEYLQRSAPVNAQAIRQYQEQERRSEVRLEIEREFAAARRDPSRISALGKLLEKHGVYEQFEDRFYRLIR